MDQPKVFGGLGKFGLSNPLRQPSRGIGGAQIWFPQLHIYATGNYSTTNTTDFLYAFSTNIKTYGLTFVTLMMLAHVRLRHSAPPASVDVRIFLDFGNVTNTGYYVLEADNQLVNSATIDTSVALGGTQDLNAFAIVPGIHTIGLALRNNTTGTLTMTNTSEDDRENFIHTLELPWKALS